MIVTAAKWIWGGLAALVGVAVASKASGATGPGAAGPAVPFLQARNYRKGRTKKIDSIVIHTMEAPETASTAHNVAQWFAGPSAPMASAHYNVDGGGIWQSVRDEDTAFHAPPLNDQSIGIEHAGYARQTSEEWADPYSMAMLARSATLVASLCRRYGIPARWVDADGLRAGQAGITTHLAVTKAFGKTTHTDPGPSFPYETYLEMVRAAL